VLTLRLTGIEGKLYNVPPAWAEKN